MIRSAKPGSFIVGADLREFVVALDCAGHENRRHVQPRSAIVSATLGDAAGDSGRDRWPVPRRRCGVGRLVRPSPHGRRAESTIGFSGDQARALPWLGRDGSHIARCRAGSAVEMVTTGEPVDARTATLMGLATDRVPDQRLQEEAISLIRAERRSLAYLEDRRRWSQALAVNETEMTFLAATAGALIQQQTRGNYPAPTAVLEMMLESASLGIEAACMAEAEGMANLFGSPVNRARSMCFSSSIETRKTRAYSGATFSRFRCVDRRYRCRHHGPWYRCRKPEAKRPSFDHRCCSPDALHSGVEKLLEEAAYNKQMRGPDTERAVHFASLLSATSNLDDLASADLVVEAVIENLDIKRQIFARLEPQMRPDAVLASNTSTIPITQLAEGLTRPERHLRHPFFQSGQKNAAGGSNSGKAHQRSNRRHGSRLCQKRRQDAGRRERWARILGQSTFVAVSDRVSRTTARWRRAIGD